MLKLLGIAVMATLLGFFSWYVAFGLVPELIEKWKKGKER